MARPTQTPPKEMLAAVTDSTIEALNNIQRLHVCRHAEDVTGAISAGAVLLAISRVDNDEDGDGFRYLIGLPRGTQVTPYLNNFF